MTFIALGVWFWNRKSRESPSKKDKKHKTDKTDMTEKKEKTDKTYKRPHNADGDPDTTYGSWLSKLDPESEDDVGATTTQSRASESQESDSSLYNVASAQVDRTTGIKRRASSSPVHSSAVKKSWRRGVATTALGEAYTLSIGESNPMEIPDS